MARPAWMALRAAVLLGLAFGSMAADCRSGGGSPRGAAAPRSDDAVRSDVRAHLQSRYGEPFVVTRVRGHGNEATGPRRSRDFDAHPAADPALTFTGVARYDVDPPRFSDDYPCAQVARWLPEHVSEALAVPTRVRHADLRCGEGLALRPPVGEALPGGPHRLRLTVEVYDDGELPAAALAARTALTERARDLGVALEGQLVVFASALWPHTVRVGPPADSAMPSDWDWLERGRAPLDGSGPPRVWGHRRDLEEAVATLVRERVGEGAEVRVFAVGLDPRSPSAGRARIDVRVAAASLDRAAMLALVEAVGQAQSGHLLRLHGGGAQRFVCQAPPARCQPAAGPLVPPDWATP